MSGRHPVNWPDAMLCGAGTSAVGLALSPLLPGLGAIAIIVVPAVAVMLILRCAGEAVSMPPRILIGFGITSLVLGFIVVALSFAQSRDGFLTREVVIPLMLAAEALALVGVQRSEPIKDDKIA